MAISTTSVCQVLSLVGAENFKGTLSAGRWLVSKTGARSEGVTNDNDDLSSCDDVKTWCSIASGAA